jgi:hypothetical protein
MNYTAGGDCGDSSFNAKPTAKPVGESNNAVAAGSGINDSHAVA